MENKLTAVRCPNCGTDEISAVSYDGDATECWEECVCERCAHEWTNIYKLVAQTDDEVEDVVEPSTDVATLTPVSWVKPSDLDAETLITLSADLAEHRVLFESFMYYVDWIKDLTREFTDQYKDRTAEDWCVEGDYWERLEEFEDEAVEQEVKKAIFGVSVCRKDECGWDIIKEGDNHDR